MEIQLMDVRSIIPYDHNPRINDAAVVPVANSIGEFGFRQPLVLDDHNIVIAGHTRLLAAISLGMTEVPVHIASDLTPEQIRALRIADNQTATIADWDFTLLPLEINALQDMDFDLGLLGFSNDELAKILGQSTAEGLIDPDEIPAPPVVAITQPGDLWQFGKHRLLCGDSTRSADVARLMDNKLARMMFTDPPWNVAIGKDSNPRHRQRPGLANDDLSPEQFNAFLKGFVDAYSPFVDGDVYCILGASEWPTLDSTLRSRGYHWSATIIWAKDSFVLGRSKYHRRYEPIWYGWHSSKKSSFNDRRDLDDVWEIKRPKRSEEHPTMKPVELPLTAITNSSRQGDIVVDPFGGAGSTLIACEQTGRKAFLLELDPLYCDVIIDRWQRFTGRTAELKTADNVHKR